MIYWWITLEVIAILSPLWISYVGEESSYNSLFFIATQARYIKKYKQIKINEINKLQSRWSLCLLALIFSLEVLECSNTCPRTPWIVQSNSPRNSPSIIEFLIMSWICQSLVSCCCPLPLANQSTAFFFLVDCSHCT